MKKKISYLLVTTQLFNKETSSKKIICLSEFSKSFNLIKKNHRKQITIKHPWCDEKKKT